MKYSRSKRWARWLSLDRLKELPGQFLWPVRLVLHASH
jgi:hypothetical protein